MKKLLFLILLVFITGCSATYNLSYENGVIKENIFIKDYYNDGNGEGEPDIEYYQKENIYFDVNNLESFDVNVDRKFNGNYDITFDAVYDEISYEDAVVLNDCVEFYEYIEDDDTIYIAAYGEYYCYGFNSLSVNFISDKKLLYSNHHDEVNGKYIWNYEYGDMIDIELEVSKGESRGITFWMLKYILWFGVAGIIVVLLLIFGIQFYRMYRSNKEV